MKKTYQDYLFVIIQFMLFGVYLFPIRLCSIHSLNSLTVLGAITSVLGGLLIGISLIQLNTNLSPYPSPKSDASLVKTGVYKFVRHPIYTGIILLLSGYAVYVSSGFKGMITLFLMILFYFKSTYEEQKLLKKYIDYVDYKKTTGRFFPKIF